LRVPLNLVSLKDLKIREKIEKVGKNYKENTILKDNFIAKFLDFQC